MCMSHMKKYFCTCIDCKFVIPTGKNKLNMKKTIDKRVQDKQVQDKRVQIIRQRKMTRINSRDKSAVLPTAV